MLVKTLNLRLLDPKSQENQIQFPKNKKMKDFMFGTWWWRTFLLGIIALVFIGQPELARGLGKGIREFQKAKNELLNEEDGDDLVEHDKSSSSDSNLLLRRNRQMSLQEKESSNE